MKVRTGKMRSLMASAIRKSRKPAKVKAKVSPTKPPRVVQAMLSKMPQQKAAAPAGLTRGDIITRALDMMQREQAMKSLQEMGQ